MLTDEGDISNYLGFNTKKKSDGTFKLSQLHLMEKIINHVGFEVSASLKYRDTPAGKLLLHKYEYSLRRNILRNYRSEFGMLSYLQGSIQPEISMDIQQCASVFNNTCLAHKHANKRISKYLASTSINVDLPEKKMVNHMRLIVQA